MNRLREWLRWDEGGRERVGRKSHDAAALAAACMAMLV